MKFKQYLSESIYGLRLDDFLNGLSNDDRSLMFINFIEIDDKYKILNTLQCRYTIANVKNLYRTFKNKKIIVSKYRINRLKRILNILIKDIDINGEDPFKFKNIAFLKSTTLDDQDQAYIKNFLTEK